MPGDFRSFADPQIRRGITECLDRSVGVGFCLPGDHDRTSDQDNMNSPVTTCSCTSNDGKTPKRQPRRSFRRPTVVANTNNRQIRRIIVRRSSSSIVLRHHPRDVRFEPASSNTEAPCLPQSTPSRVRSIQCPKRLGGSARSRKYPRRQWSCLLPSSSARSVSSEQAPVLHKPDALLVRQAWHQRPELPTGRAMLGLLSSATSKETRHLRPDPQLARPGARRRP
jgi:hypothetical protein